MQRRHQTRLMQMVGGLYGLTFAISVGLLYLSGSRIFGWVASFSIPILSVLVLVFVNRRRRRTEERGYAAKTPEAMDTARVPAKAGASPPRCLCHLLGISGAFSMRGEGATIRTNKRSHVQASLRSASEIPTTRSRLPPTAHMRSRSSPSDAPCMTAATEGVFSQRHGTATPPSAREGRGRIVASDALLLTQAVFVQPCFARRLFSCFDCLAVGCL
jgi:hypothetical protein